MTPPPVGRHYFSRVLDWYQKGGFVDELGRRHRSGHNYSFGFLEVLNEVNLHADVYIGPTPLDSIRNYIRFYDGVAKVVRANHPGIKLIGNCMAGAGSALVWRTFLNRSEHAGGTPWPIDAVSYHVYSGAASPPEWGQWAQALRPSALANTVGAAASARVIKQLSPTTKIFMDEVGCAARSHLSLCSTARPLYTRITSIIGTSVFETTMRPNPRSACCSAATRRST
jgi:hypothetical protein